LAARVNAFRVRSRRKTGPARHGSVRKISEVVPFPHPKPHCKTVGEDIAGSLTITYLNSFIFLSALGERVGVRGK
jgi:hypothetical protein